MTDQQIPKTDNTAHQLSYARRQINEFLQDEMEAVGLEGFVPSHGDLISQLSRHSPMTMTDLSDAIHRDRSTVTTLVKKLVKLGFVQLEGNPKDSRSRLVSLTEQGEALYDDFHDISIRLMQVTWQGINVEEREQFRTLLDQIIRNFSNHKRRKTNEES